MSYVAPPVELPSIVPWLVWIVPIVGALLSLPLSRAGGDRALGYGAVAVSFVSALLASSMLPAVLSGRYEVVDYAIPRQITWIPSIGITAGVLADPLAILLSNIVAWISFLIMLYSIGYMRGERDLTRYWFLMNFFIGNMQLIVLSDNFLQLFFGWEGVGFCSYALIGFWHSDEERYWVGTPGHRAWGLHQAYAPSHAGMKAFVTTRIGDVSFLIGMLILFSFSGTFNFTTLAESREWARGLAQAGLFVPVAILIFGGAVGKSAQFPLHEWLPDAMAGPTAVSALIHAATMVKAGVFLVARVGPIFYFAATSAQQVEAFFLTVAVIGAFTALLAATQGAVAREIKKVLAYSTVSQIGYMMLALGAAGLAEDFSSGYTAGFFQLTSHAFFKATLFLGAGAMIHATESKYMDEMGGLRSRMRITFASMLIAAASLSGIPPLSGFWSKDAVLASVLGIRNPSIAASLFLIAVFTALITAFYSFRMIGMAFAGGKSHHLEELERRGHHLHEAPAVMWLPYALLAGVTVAIGFVGPFFEERLHEILSEEINHAFGVSVGRAGAGINPIALGSSLVASFLGLYLAYHYYIARRGSAEALVTPRPLLKGLQTFLVNRWYINALTYKIFSSGTMLASRWIYRGLEAGFIDRLNDWGSGGWIVFSRAGNWIDVHIVDGAINGMMWLSVRFSRVARLVQTGVTEQYIFAFALGIILLAAILVFMI